MPTFNQLASKVANIINQPFSHELKERIKDSFKHIYAARVRQSIERYGIDSISLMSYVLELENYDMSNERLTPFKGIRDSNKVNPALRSIDKVLTPIRFNNDAPFTYVGLNIPIPYRSEAEVKTMVWDQFKTNLAYYLDNGRIVVVSTNPNSSPKLKYIRVESIYEDPEQVLNYYNDLDWDDTIIPIPNDMIQSILYEILKTEFGLMRPEDITVAQDNVPGIK